MIGLLRGRLVECRPDRALLDVHGVGYLLRIPLSTYYVLADGEPDACLHVHTHVREDAIQLYGFSTVLERSTFERLIGISGVGPRLALAVLSGIGTEELSQCVAERDAGRLQKIPGIGRKTAERIVLELEGKLLQVAGDPGRKLPAGEPAGSFRADAVSALINLGYPAEGARRAVDAARERLGPSAAIEAVLREALGKLSR